MNDAHRPFRWRLGLFAALAVTLVALYPQFRLQLTRGKEWNGSYAFFSQDEIAYSAYVNALIEGRPRRNDPYTGRDEAPGSPQHESLFSIQFAPAYLIAGPARLFGLTAPTTFIALNALVAFASALAIFWLIGLIIADERVAATGALVVLCLGTFALLYAPLRTLLGIDTTYTYEYFPFLRRYVPAVAFPLFFVFCGMVWHSLTSGNKRAIWTAVAMAGAVFALLVYSYFYLWTAAAAWLGCLISLWLIARPQGYKTAIKILSIIAALAIVALLPYVALVANRAPSMDAVQLLANSHAPDFSRSSIKLGLIVCALIAYCIWRGRFKWKDPAVLFTASLALTPLLVFNQQVITGLSLQPLHYELYIAKYLALAALVLTIALNWRTRERAESTLRNRVLVCVAVVALGWGMIETAVETKRHEWASLDRDAALPVARRLLEFSRSSATRSLEAQAVVLYFNLDHADISPVIAPQPVLWAPHTPAFSGVTTDENRSRLYQYLYYTAEELTAIDAEKFAALDYRKKYLIHSLIEWGHNDPSWTVNWKEFSVEDIRAALGGYGRYVASFDREQASNPTLSYVVTDGEANLDNLDRWYERDEGEQIGRFRLYRVKLRQ